MTQLLAHEKLTVYQKTLSFAKLRSQLLQAVPRRVAASDHFTRSSESILLNIAHASSSSSPKERIVYLGHSNGSALECAACLDILVAKALLTSDDVFDAKSLLVEIVSMLIAMQNTTSKRVREEHAPYRTKTGRFFSHEDLDVYQKALDLTAWIENTIQTFSCSTDLLSKLDKATTSIALNIAEGTGRFTRTDKAKFYGIAYKAAVQSAALLDLTTVTSSSPPSQLDPGRELLRQIAAMLTGLTKAVSHDS